MNLEFTREQLSGLSVTGDINRFDGLNVVVNLNGKLYEGILETQFNGTATVVFKNGNYYEQENIEITSPDIESRVTEIVKGLSIAIG